MLRVIKWAYDLGVRNERHRIAGYLSSVQTQRYERSGLFDEELRQHPVISKEDAKKRDIEKRQIQRVVDQNVIDIIDSIFRGEEKYTRGASVMFPDGEEK